MSYRVEFKSKAQEDFQRLLKSEPKAYKKALKLVGELMSIPRRAPGIPSNSRVIQRAAGAAASPRGTG